MPKYGLKIPRIMVRFEQESEWENASKYGLKIPRNTVELDGHEFHERAKYQVGQ